MIEFVNVTKHYKTPNSKKIILSSYSGSLKAKKGIAILGGNGSGKSTLVRLISGTEIPNDGKIIRHKKCSWPMGLSGTFKPSMTGADNVSFVARIYNQNQKRILEEVKEFADIGDYINMPVGTYSSGMKARLAFGLSLSVNFDIYLIDEIIAVGDKTFKEKSKKKLLEKIESAKVILVSHQENTIREFCDKCAILRNGRLDIYNELDEGLHEYKELQNE